MKIPSLRWLTLGLPLLALPALLPAQLRLEDPIAYADGELNTVSSNLWRFRGTPYAEVVNGAIVVDYTAGRTFNGGYQRLWEAPSSREQIYYSFKLTVTVAPTEILGVPLAGVADVDAPDLYRGRLFMKRGVEPGTFRLGLASQSALPENALFFPADLQLNEEYLVIGFWDNQNLVTRLYIDTNDAGSPAVEISGGTARSAGFRRFGIQMDSTRPLGRLEIRNIRVGEDFASVVQAFTQKPDFVLDPPGLLLDERFDYAAGELISVSGGAWRVFPSEGTPFGTVSDGALVFDSNAGTFLGEYHRLFPVPADPSNLYASYRLRVTEAPLEPTGFNISSFADREVPEAQRARVFMKAGNAPGTFRLGLSVSSSVVADDGVAQAVFIDEDLVVGRDYLILTSWDNVGFVARLYLNTDDAGSPAIELVGEAPREIRRFSFRTNSSFNMGRYEVSNLLVGEFWENVLQPFEVADLEPGWYDDPVLGLHYYVGRGWALWTDATGATPRGVLWLSSREEDGGGWLHHGERGWLYLVPGSIAEGLFAYSVDLGWIYAWNGFGESFYRYASEAFYPWVP